MRVLVKKWGNGAAVRIPASVMQATNLNLDQHVNVKEERGRVVRYDNETDKGSHRHIGPREAESVFEFVSLVQILTNFAQDIETFREVSSEAYRDQRH